jgi:manganese/iron transport system substrate-binding protein
MMRHTLSGLLKAVTLMAILVFLAAGCQGLARNRTTPAQENAQQNGENAQQNRENAYQNGDISENVQEDGDVHEADDDYGAEDEDAHEADDEHGYGDVLPHLDAVSLGEGERLRVVATTSIVADIVSRVGGTHIELTRLMPLGVDTHAFEPTPRDAATLADAHVIFINGADLERFLDSFLESANGVPVVPVSAGIELLPFELDDHDDDQQDDDDHGHEGEGDPHVWFDPNMVLVWVHNIEEALSDLDPRHANSYAANAEAFEDELEALDAWIQDQVAAVPEERRLLVTDHALLTYFAARYGFEQVGAVIPATTTVAEPSAQELAALQDAIGQYSVPAIFVGHEVSSRVAEQIAADTGVKLVFIYTESLSDENGPAATYMDYMRYNVNAIVEGLSQ